MIQCAAQQDYDAFYEQEIRMRRMREQPPFCDLLIISASGAEETAVLRGCMRLRDALSDALAQSPYNQYGYRLLGPAPAIVAKVNNRYRYRMILNIKNTKEVRQLVSHLLRKALADRQNRNVSFFADFDPLD